MPGRFCAPVPSSAGTIECCLPCPVADWIYSDGMSAYPLAGPNRCLLGRVEFKTIPRAANWLNVAGMVCTVSLLVSFVVLPVQKTSRHYLTVCFIIAVCILQVRIRPILQIPSGADQGKLGFIIPLGSQPDQCHDAITPNDMYSDITCAFSGACLLVGGFAAISWGTQAVKG